MVDEHEPRGGDAAFFKFLLEEGFEALSAYRAIRDPSLRAMFIKMMKEAAEAEQNPALHPN